MAKETPSMVFPPADVMVIGLVSEVPEKSLMNIDLPGLGDAGNITDAGPAVTFMNTTSFAVVTVYGVVVTMTV